MRIGLLNWSGHQNIGDDAMASLIQQALEKRGHVVVNQGEHPNPFGIDAYFWGGGTLISEGGIWPVLPTKVPIIGFGIGVSESPPANILVEDQLDDVKRIFARDYYSYIQLVKKGMPATLSYDPMFLLDIPMKSQDRTYVAVNIIDSPKTDFGYVKQLLDKYKGEDIRGFAVGLPEDPLGCREFGIPCEFYDDPLKLIDFLSGAKVSIATRLHANILAYLAEVPIVEPVIYDPKIKRFIEYVVNNKIDPKYMRERLNEHIDYALSLLGAR